MSHLVCHKDKKEVYAVEEYVNELVSAANLLRTVKVDGEYWFTMTAIYNSLIQVAQKLQESGVNDNETINNGADA